MAQPAIANYAIDPELLKLFPFRQNWKQTVKGTCISLVGFMFVNTCGLLGIRIPFHTDFEEINLRFYVRFKENNTWKRGVVFIKEIVPKPALTFVANTVYKENYETLPTHHLWQQTKEQLTVEYQYVKQVWHSLKVIADPIPVEITGSEEEFITEHYWGYARVNNTVTSNMR